MDLHSTVQWLWLSLEGYFWKDSTHGNEKLKETRDCFTFRSGSTAMGNGEYTSTFVMSELQDGLQGSDLNDKGASRLTKFCNIIGVDKDVADMFSELQDSSYPKSAKWNF